MASRMITHLIVASFATGMGFYQGLFAQSEQARKSLMLRLGSWGFMLINFFLAALNLTMALNR